MTRPGAVARTSSRFASSRSRFGSRALALVVRLLARRLGTVLAARFDDDWVFAGHARQRVDDLVGQPCAVVGAIRSGVDPDDDVVAIKLLEQHRGLLPSRRRDPVVEDVLNLRHANTAAEPDLDIDRVGLPDRDDHRRQHDVVRNHDPVLALGERRVEQAERTDDPFDLSADGTRLEPDALADAERSRAQQDHPGEQVAERLLRGETDDHGGECARRDKRGGAHAGDLERHEQRDAHRHEPDEEAHRSGGARIHPAEERRTGDAPDVASDRPAEREQRSAPSPPGSASPHDCRVCRTRSCSCRRPRSPR